MLIMTKKAGRISFSKVAYNELVYDQCDLTDKLKTRDKVINK
jgi:hypothetical protein